MTDDFRNPSTRKTLKIMIGNMYPSEMADMIEDRQVRRTDVPEWLERTLKAECKYVVERLPRYETLIRLKYGQIDSLVKKLSVYHTVCDNFDDLEPCNFEFMKPLFKYFDRNLDRATKRRIDEAIMDRAIERL